MFSFHSKTYIYCFQISYFKFDIEITNQCNKQTLIKLILNIILKF